MTEIPDDIMKAAVSALAKTYVDAGMDAIANGLLMDRTEKALNLIGAAQAIMAERERCAKVAEGWAYGPALGIAAAIRKGGEA